MEKFEKFCQSCGMPMEKLTAHQRPVGMSFFHSTGQII
jgi:hypothetical protein